MMPMARKLEMLVVSSFNGRDLGVSVMGKSAFVRGAPSDFISRK